MFFTYIILIPSSLPLVLSSYLPPLPVPFFYSLSLPLSFCPSFPPSLPPSFCPSLPPLLSFFIPSLLPTLPASLPPPCWPLLSIPSLPCHIPLSILPSFICSLLLDLFTACSWREIKQLVMVLFISWLFFSPYTARQQFNFCVFKGAMMSVAFKEGLKIPPQAMEQIIIGANQDVRQVSLPWTALMSCLSCKVISRKYCDICTFLKIFLSPALFLCQVLHNMNMWTAKEKSLSYDQAKEDAARAQKDIKMVNDSNPWF